MVLGNKYDAALKFYNWIANMPEAGASDAHWILAVFQPFPSRHPILDSRIYIVFVPCSLIFAMVVLPPFDLGAAIVFVLQSFNCEGHGSCDLGLPDLEGRRGYCTGTKKIPAAKTGHLRS